MTEIWKDISGYEQLYQVSNTGKVKSLNYNRTGKEKILKLQKDKDGYLIVNLFKECKNKSMRVHRLVCEAFISNPNNFPQVNHKNEIKEDNRVENLEWCDNRYNSNYGTRNQRISKKVMCIETGVVYPSTIEVKRKLGFNQSNISKCCRLKHYKTVGGYHWKYVD